MDEPKKPQSFYDIHLWGFPINLSIEIFVHFTALILPVLLIFRGIESKNLFLAAFLLLLALYLYPYAILLLSAMMMRLLPKPSLGYIDSKEDHLKYEILMALSTLVRRSPGRWLLMLPFGNFYYQLAGAKVDSTAIIGDPDSIHDIYLVSVGKNSVLGWGSLVLGHCLPESSRILLGMVEIGRDSLIGARSIIWPNVKIGDRSIVQNGSIVRPGTIIPSDEIWGGIPARKLRNRLQDDAQTNPVTITKSEIITSLQNYLTQYYHQRISSLDTPLKTLGLEATDISKFLAYIEREHNTFIDRTQINLETYSLKDIVNHFVSSNQASIE